MIEDLESMSLDAYIEDVEDVAEITSDFYSILEKFIEKRCVKVTHEELGIDPRSYGKLWISHCENYIITKDMIDFYSGFGFIDSSEFDSIGGYKIYSSSIPRIYDHISVYSKNKYGEE
jgi:hypothetical protein